MPRGSYLQQEVICPFYTYDDGRRKIICEGFTDRCAVDLRWRFHTDQVLHLQTFCCKKYKKCEIYRMVMESKYYDDEGEET